MALTKIKGTNCWTIREDAAADLISGCSATWRFLGVKDEAEARAGNMFNNALPMPEDGLSYDRGEDGLQPESERYFPSIVIGAPGGDDDVPFEVEQIATGPVYGARGLVICIFRMLPAIGEEEADQDRIFQNAFGDVVEDVQKKNAKFSPFSISVVGWGRGELQDYQSLGQFIYGRIDMVWSNMGQEE